jgi:paraquat-inducible protein B
MDTVDRSKGKPSAPTPTAKARRSRRIPLVWLVPLVTLAIGAWLAWDTWSKRGPTITIAFESAAGLQAGQSQLKYKDVTLGTVKALDISPDQTKVVVTVETVHAAAPLINDKTTFWVVKPQLFAGRISGLDTLLSGSYIGMLPSTEPGKAQHHFIGQPDPPVLATQVPGTTFLLNARRVGSLSVGAPIFYRDIDVGTVLGWDLADMARHVTVHAFVRAPFDKYVHDDSAFWNASGLSVRLTSSGIKVQMESLRALLLGGIAFDTRPDSKEPVSAANHPFTLYADHEAALSAGFGKRLHMVSYFSGSVTGLEVGADVTLHGLKIGQVTDVDLFFDAAQNRIMVPVHYEVEGDRIVGVAAIQGAPTGRVAAEMVKLGFRATLQSTSLISGQKVVAIENVPGAPPAELKIEGDTFIMPSADAGGLDSLTQSATELLTKINRIDFVAIGKNVAGATKGLDDIVNGAQLKQSLASLQASLSDVQDFMRKLDTDAGPAMARLPEISRKLEDSLTSINKLAGSVSRGYGDDSRFNRELDRLLPQLNDAVRSIRSLTDLLSRHPEALIKGRPGTGKE